MHILNHLHKNIKNIRNEIKNENNKSSKPKKDIFNFLPKFYEFFFLSIGWFGGFQFVHVDKASGWK